MDVPLSWHTDLAVLVASGSAVEEHADHLVVRTPTDPTYDWGNLVMVTDPATVDDAARWEAVFTSSFPGAGHRAIGLPTEPTDVAAWEACGLEIEHEDVLVRDAPLERRPLAEGYVVRQLTSDEDWERSRPVRREARRRVVDGGNAVFLGAFAGDELAADTAGSGRPSPAARHTGRRSAPDPFPRDPSPRFSHVPTAPGPRRAPARRTARLLGG